MHIDIKYITMCEQTEEVQEEWIPAAGDYFWLGHKFLKIFSSCRLLTIDPRLFNPTNEVWLPTQDQLQDMILKACDYETTWDLIDGFHRYLIWIDDWDFTSLEQLWLAYVMKAKYNKVWNEKRMVWIGERDE